MNMNYQEAKLRAEIMKALAHPVRILLIDALMQGDQTAGALCKVEKINPSNISRHLAHLKKVGIVSDRRKKMNVIYHLETPCILEAFNCAMDVVRSDAARRERLLRTARDGT